MYFTQVTICLNKMQLKIKTFPLRIPPNGWNTLLTFGYIAGQKI